MTLIRPMGILLLVQSLASAGVLDEAPRTSGKQENDKAAAALKVGLEALKMEEYDKAIQSFDAYLRTNPNDPQGYYGRGFACALKKEYAQAVKDFTEVIRLDPEAAMPHDMRGNAYVAIQQYDKALRDYNNAIRLDSNSPRAFLDRGNLYVERKEYNKAIADFTEAIRLAPEVSFAYTDRGRAYVEQKKFNKALKDFHKAVRLDRDDGDAQNELAWLLATCPHDGVRDGKKAVEHARRACALSHWKDAVCLDTLAAAHAECGEFEKAVKWEKKAMERRMEKEDLEKAGERLKLYREEKPYRDE
jgi:tetratricopeptide (TPR) repeat protein